VIFNVLVGMSLHALILIYCIGNLHVYKHKFHFMLKVKVTLDHLQLFL